MPNDSSTTSTTSNTSASDLGAPVTAGGVGRPRPVQRDHQVTAQFGVWGTQRVQVHASAGGGPGDLPYLAVTVGDCLTYVYDREALASHVMAWRDGAAYNQSFRLPPVPAGPEDRGAGAGRQDLMLVCSVFGGQRHTVTGAATGGVRVLSVVVGAVTVRVHSSEALRCYLLAWTRAQALAAVLDPPADPLLDLPGGP